jgi:hypothetical protein
MIPFENPRHGLVRKWAGWMDRVAAVAFVLALAAALLPGDAGEALGIALVVLLVAFPLGRVGLAALRFSRIGDRRYAGVALALLAIVAVGSITAVLGS